MKVIAMPTAVAAAILCTLMLVATTAAQSPPATSVPGAPVPSAHVDKDVYVVGRDVAVTISTELPRDGCAGTTATAKFYTRTPDDPTPIAPSRLALQQDATATVAADGAVSIAIPLPSELTGGPEILSAGIADPECLDGLVLYPSSFQVAILDEAENPGGSATIVIPAAALNASPNNGLGSYAVQVGSLTVLANGVECTTASLTEGPAIDAEGNARIHIGTSDQPAACHEPNARLTFVNANGQTLFEKYTLLPGVTQALQNFAGEPSGTSGTPTPAPSATTTTPTVVSTPSATETSSTAPLPPDTGSGVSKDSSSAAWLLVAGCVIAAISLTTLVYRRRRS